jgi:hypothetical protein
VTFVPFFATAVSDTVNEEAVYRLQWLIPVPLILAYSLDRSAGWLAARWQVVKQPLLTSLLPVVGILALVVTALVVQEHYVIADDWAYYERTSSSALLPWTDGSIFLGGVDRTFSSGSRPTGAEEELFARMQERLPPDSEVLIQRSLGIFLYGFLYRVRPVIYGGAEAYLFRNLLVTALDDGLLERDELDEAIRTFDIDLVVLQRGTLTDNALRAFARYDARDLEIRQGEPELIVHERADGSSFSAWAFGALEREQVGGQRFTVTDDIDPTDRTLSYVVKLAPSEALIGNETVRMVVSYWAVGPDTDQTVYNTTADILLPAGTPAGEIVKRLRSPSTEFAPGTVVEFVVWRSLDAAEDTYPADVWFTGIDVNYPSESLDRVGSTPYYFYESTADDSVECIDTPATPCTR